VAGVLGFTEDDLRGAADVRSFERGLGYLSQVGDLRIEGTRVTATVLGSDAYEVRLEYGTSGLHGDCSCPFGVEGNFCKHCVAAGLVALKASSSASPHSQAAPAQRPGRQLVVSWLSSLTKDELAAELLELLDEDAELGSRFELKAAAQQVDTATLGNAVRDLIYVDGYIDWDEAAAYAANVRRAVGAIGELIDVGAADEAVAIAFDAIGWLTEACAAVDDSSGFIGEVAAELLAVHLSACQAAPPDPVSLAIGLADLVLNDDYGFAPEVEQYAALLGEEGMATIREEVAAMYRMHPDNFRARHMMEAILKAEGDVDALIAHYAAHLDDHGWQHFAIVRELDAVGRAAEAISWAERGARELARPDGRLVEYLAGRYAAAGRGEDLLSLRRVRFQAERNLAGYQALRAAATSAGTWETERGKALAQLRADAADTYRYWGGPVLIDALIDDGDLAAAWSAAPEAASDAQWIRLADASVSERPAEALAVYRTVIERLATNTGDEIYRQIANHLLSARACHEALGTLNEFRQYLEWLRLVQKRKRNLMKILDQNGLR